MSIDLECYSTFSVDSVSEKLNDLVNNFPDYFDGNYKIDKIWKVLSHEELNNVEDRVRRYTLESYLLLAEEHGFIQPKSMFSIGVLDKTFEKYSIEEMSNLLKEKFGIKHILILLNGEVEI